MSDILKELTDEEKEGLEVYLRIGKGLETDNDPIEFTISTQQAKDLCAYITNRNLALYNLLTRLGDLEGKPYTGVAYMRQDLKRGSLTPPLSEDSE